MRNSKLLHLLKNSLLGGAVVGLAACQGPTRYHSYHPIPSEGWGKGDTLVYALSAPLPAGSYEATIGIRCTDAYPYRDIWLSVSHNLFDSLHYTTDTLHLFLVDEEDRRVESGPGGLYSVDWTYQSSLPLSQEVPAPVFRITHIMKDRPLKGINDLGLRIRKN